MARRTSSVTSSSVVQSCDGDGDAYYYGGGVLGRMDFANTGPGSFYTEAAARMGRIHNEYDTSGLRDALGSSAGGYDSSSLYYGLHDYPRRASFDAGSALP